MYSSYFIFVGKSEPIGYWINELLRTRDRMPSGGSHTIKLPSPVSVCLDQTLQRENEILFRASLEVALAQEADFAGEVEWLPS